MKDIVLFSMMVLVAVAPAEVGAAPPQGCDQIVQDLNALADSISSGAGAYWSHRKNFLELTYGRSRLTNPQASELAAQEKTSAAPLKTAMAISTANFKALLKTAQTQSCLTPRDCWPSRNRPSNKLGASTSISSPERLLSRG